jgi:toxin YoeB
MEVAFDELAMKDLQFWKDSGNIAIQKKIQKLLSDIQESPYTGIGKPELLKYDLAGTWSRRINSVHRIVYSVYQNIIQVHSLRGHYKF